MLRFCLIFYFLFTIHPILAFGQVKRPVLSEAFSKVPNSSHQIDLGLNIYEIGWELKGGLNNEANLKNQTFGFKYAYGFSDEIEFYGGIDVVNETLSTIGGVANDKQINSGIEGVVIGGDYLGSWASGIFRLGVELMYPLLGQEQDSNGNINGSVGQIQLLGRSGFMKSFANVNLGAELNFTLLNQGGTKKNLSNNSSVEFTGGEVSELIFFLERNIKDSIAGVKYVSRVRNELVDEFDAVLELKRKEVEILGYWNVNLIDSSYLIPSIGLIRASREGGGIEYLEDQGLKVGLGVRVILE